MKLYFIFLTLLLLVFNGHAQIRHKKKFTKQQRRTLKSTKGFGGGGFNPSVLKTNFFDLQGGIGKESYYVGASYTKSITGKLIKGQILYESGKYYEVDYAGLYLSVMGGYQLVNLNEKLHLSAYLGGTIVNDDYDLPFLRETGILEEISRVNYGGVGAVEVDVGITKGIFLFANFQQYYIISSPENQRGRWLSGGGIRFLL